MEKHGYCSKSELPDYFMIENPLNCARRQTLASQFYIRELSKHDDDGESVGKKMNLRFFKFNRIYLDSLNMSNTGDFSWS